jgi:ABC-type antimicrobial peptide transport system permease subunit
MREVGIRIALGATRGDIKTMILPEGMRLAMLGVKAGRLASILLARLLSSLLYGVRSFDLETSLLTITILATTTSTATLVPACRRLPSATGHRLANRIAIGLDSQVIVPSFHAKGLGG